MTLKSPGTLLTESYAFYMQHAKLLVSIAIIPALVSGGAIILASLNTVGDPSETPLGIVGGLASALLGIFTTVVLVQTIAHISESITLQAAYARAMPIFLSYFWVAILSGLAVIAGLILFIIPGIIVGVWLCFTHVTAILEGKRGGAALKSSKEYVKGIWFDIFMRLLVIGAVILVTIIAISLLLSVFLGDGAVFTAASDLVSTAIAPFGLVYVYFMYKDVQKMKAHQGVEPVVIAA